ncbi:7942_t:CDS:2 [Acaulospora colombiana]|uniref:7942_t:CDS:1 n=1 Tax=Acaulospora colombiana TaxID=27376 RepID=A0ACA9N6W6_9GLOM|nr:7942_t:CDS:2 [Acaulospora colombiana]
MPIRPQDLARTLSLIVGWKSRRGTEASMNLGETAQLEQKENQHKTPNQGGHSPIMMGMGRKNSRPNRSNTSGATTTQSDQSLNTVD